MFVCEVYFLEFVCDIVGIVCMLLMVMGGIWCWVVVEQVVDSGVDMVGIVMVLFIDLNLLCDWVGGKNSVLVLQFIIWKNKVLGVFVNMVVVKFQFSRLSEGCMMVFGVLFL